MSEPHEFLFDGQPVRGMLVRLTDSWRQLLARRAGAAAFAPEVRALVGEMAAASVLMQTDIKFNGALVLQVHGDWPVKLAVAEAQPDLVFRATAAVTGTVPEGAAFEALVNVQGKRRCAITLDPRERLPGQQPYQGVVPCTTTDASRCSSCRRCWSTTCCSPGSWTRAWCWPPTSAWPRAR